MVKASKDIHSKREILRVLYDEYVAQYEEEPKRFDDETRIFADLHADEPDPVYALEWRAKVAKRLAIPEQCLPRPVKSRDYTIGELAHIIQEVQDSYNK